MQKIRGVQVAARGRIMGVSQMGEVWIEMTDSDSIQRIVVLTVNETEELITQLDELCSEARYNLETDNAED